MELMISGTLFIDVPKDSPNNNYGNLFLAIYFIMIPVLVIPAMFFWVFTNSLEDLKKKKF